MILRGIPPEELRGLDAGRVSVVHPREVPRAHDEEVVQQPRAELQEVGVFRGHFRGGCATNRGKRMFRGKSLRFPSYR